MSIAPAEAEVEFFFGVGDAALHVVFLLVLEGGEIPAPRFYRARERKLRRAQTHLSRARRDSRNRGNG